LSNTFCTAALRTISIEQSAIANLKHRIGDHFERACELLLNCQGHIVVIGMGKSGHIAGKLAATLASTGSPAFFVHPGEASHGDLGMITTSDVILALSYSGTTAEIVTLLPPLQHLGIPLVAMTGESRSTLAHHADAHLDISVESEACPLGLTPTSSTTACLVMGDALAIALLEARGLSAEDFAFSHPGGALGRRLLLKLADIMHQGSALPLVSEQTNLADTLLEMTQKGLGMAAVVNKAGKLVGIYTDGDLRRSLEQPRDLRYTAIADLMSLEPMTAKANMLAVQALRVMEYNKINALVIIDRNHHPIGAINMHDLLRAGVL
jgi:arabinose-5-phosphate isomerase